MAEDANELSPGAMNRRNALKAGAAIGIGAVAMAGPQIGILGSTPAYAAACSAPWVGVGSSDCINTSCNCPGSTIEYKEQTLAGFATVNNGCGGVTTASILGTGAYAQCRVRVVAYRGNPQCVANTASAIIGTATTPGGVAGANVIVPSINCAGEANIFTRIFVECNTDTTIGCD